jgi:hypothetical protein
MTDLRAEAPVLLLIKLVLGLLSLGATVDVETVAGPVRFTDLYGSPREAVAASGCAEGESTIWISDQGASFEVILHELAHAYDCADNGAIDGSPAGHTDQRPSWASDYCWNSPAERYACAVTETGQLRPFSVQLEPPKLAKSWASWAHWPR